MTDFKPGLEGVIAFETEIAEPNKDGGWLPADITPAMFTCARTAGWAAHIMEQKLTGRLVRPSSRYTGPGQRPIRDVTGAAGVLP